MLMSKVLYIGNKGEEETQAEPRWLVHAQKVKWNPVQCQIKDNLHTWLH